MTLDGALTSLTTLITDRLRIRQMQIEDADALYLIKSNPVVTSRYGQMPHRSVDETGAWIQRCLADYERRGTVVWIFTFKHEDIAVGECCFWNFDRDFLCAEIGYELHPVHWNKGIMKEALSAILTYGFIELGLHRIEANPLATNEPSQRLLIKLGFKHEGTLRQRHFFGGRFEDQEYFGLLKDEWMGRLSDL